MGRGMVGHVPIVAILMVVQGLLEIVFGLFCLAVAALFRFSSEKELANMQSLGLLFCLISAPALGCGVLRLVAGYCNYSFRRRILGMAALGIGMLTMMTAYCAPTSIALAIYGLIVYVNEPVVAAFELGRQGRNTAEIQAAFPPPQ